MSKENQKRESEKADAEKELTPKQKLFCGFYLGQARFNGTKAAILAGYSEKTAKEIASENLTKPNISNYIEAQLKTLTLGANEVLARLTEIANADIDDFLDEEGNIKIKCGRDNEKTHLIKKIKRKTTNKQISDESGEEIETVLLHEETEIEIYSAHEALRDLGKYHKLFTDKIEAKVENENPAQVVFYLPDNKRDAPATETNEADTEKQ